MRSICKLPLRDCEEGVTLNPGQMPGTILWSRPSRRHPACRIRQHAGLSSQEVLLSRPFPDCPLVVAYGLGVDSTAMLIELAHRDIRPDLILFADTNGE